MNSEEVIVNSEAEEETQPCTPGQHDYVGLQLLRLVCRKCACGSIELGEIPWFGAEGQIATPIANPAVPVLRGERAGVITPEEYRIVYADFPNLEARFSAAETEHKMAAAEWAVRETDLKEIIEGGNRACAEIANQRDEEQNERMGLAQDMEAARVRIADLAKSLGELGCYIAGLKTYDEDPSAQRMVKRALGLLRSADAAPGIPPEGGTTNIAGEECQRLGHDFVVENYQMVCSRCPNPGAPTDVSSTALQAESDSTYTCGFCGKVNPNSKHRVLCGFCGRAPDGAMFVRSPPSYAPGVPPEDRTTETEAEPRTIVESHPGKGNPLVDTILTSGKNDAAVNGESYNAAAASLRAITPIAEPIWEGDGEDADKYRFDEEDATFFALCQPARVAYSETADLPGMLCDYANRINGGLGPGAEFLCDEMGHYGRAQYAQGWSKCEAVYRGIIQTGAEPWTLDRATEMQEELVALLWDFARDVHTGPQTRSSDGTSANSDKIGITLKAIQILFNAPSVEIQ